MPNAPTRIERAPFPQIFEKFTTKATIEDEEGKDFTVKFSGNVDDCNEWLGKISKTFPVLKYDIIFINATIEMV